MTTKYVLKLYITGQTSSSIRVLRNLQNILKNELKGLYKLKGIDVLKDPRRAEENKILATLAMTMDLLPP